MMICPKCKTPNALLDTICCGIPVVRRDDAGGQLRRQNNAPRGKISELSWREALGMGQLTFVVTFSVFTLVGMPLAFAGFMSALLAMAVLVL